MKLKQTSSLLTLFLVHFQALLLLASPMCSPKFNVIGSGALHSTINYIQQDKGLHVLLSFENSSENCSIKLTFPNSESRFYTLSNESGTLGWKLIRDNKFNHIVRLINENEKDVKEGYYRMELDNSTILDFYALKKRNPYFKTEKERLDNKTYFIKVNLGFHTCLFYNEHFPSLNGSNIELICDKKRICSLEEVSYIPSKFHKYYKVTVHNDTLSNVSLVCFITNFPDQSRTWYSKLSWPVNEAIEPKKVHLKVDHPIVLIVVLTLSCLILLFAMLVIVVNRIKGSSKNGAIQTFIVTNEEELDLQSSSGTTAAMIMGSSGRPRLLSLKSTTSTYISNNTLATTGNQFLAVPTTAITSQGDHQKEAGKIKDEPLFKNRFTDFHNLEMSSIIGEGNFGRVKAAILRDKGACWEVAVKYIKSNGSMDDFEQKELIKEAKTMLKIGYHPNIVNLQRVTIDSAGTFYLILEYCSNDSLLKYLRMERQRYKEALAFETYKGYIQDGNNKCNEDVNTMISWGFQIASGMAFLYERDVIQLHGDLAARNILLTTDLTAKISDFGLSHRLYNHYVTSDMRTDVLPSRWMAPEALRDIKLSKYTDLWSFGVVIWEIFSLGETPYSSIRGDNINKLLLETLSSGQRLMTPLHTPGEIETLMNDCWNSIPSLRPSFKTLMGRLEKLLSPAYRRREQALNDAMWTQYSKICNKLYFQMSSSHKLEDDCDEYTPKSRSSYLRIDK